MKGWKGNDVVDGRGALGPELFASRSACVDASPDGTTLVAGDGIGGLVVLDQRTFERQREIRVPIVRCRLGAFSPDGSTFVTHAWLARGSARPVLGLAVIDVTTGAVRSVPMAMAQGGGARRILVGPPAFSPDGTELLTLETPGTPVGVSADAEWPEILAVRRDPRTGRERARATPIEVREGIAWAGYLPDGHSVVVSASTGAELDEQGRPGTATAVLDADTFQQQRRFGVSSHVAALSPDGRTLALARVPAPDRVTMLDLRSGEQRTLTGRHEGRITGVGFSPDGTALVTTGDDRAVIVWDAETGILRERLVGHAGAAFGPAFSADGGTAFTAGLDEAVIAWDLAGDRRLAQGLAWAREDELPGAGSWTGAALAADGRVLIRGSQDGRVVALSVPDGRVVWSSKVWGGDRLELLAKAWSRVYERSFAKRNAGLPPPADAPSAVGLSGNVVSVAVSPDGSLVAATAQTQEVAVLDAKSGRVVGRWRASRVPWVNTVAFTADGGSLVTGDDDGRVVVWEPRSGKRLAAFRIPDRQVVVALPSPDGERVAVFTQPSWFAYPNGRPPPSEQAARIGVWDVAKGAPLWEAEPSELNFWARPVLAASPDWRTLVSGGFARDVRFWDVGTGTPLGAPLAASEGFALSAAFDPAGRILLTAGTDGRTRLFDVATRLPLGSSLPGDDNRWTTALFGPGGQSLLALSNTGRGWLWDVSVENLRERACRVANRPLSEEEWRRYLPGRRYDPACS
jgi:WD40 repeat protein